MICLKISTCLFTFSEVVRRNRKFDLQLFNGEKTEQATPKRKSDARKKGQVAKSVELNTAIVLLGSFFGLQVLGTIIYHDLAKLMTQTLGHLYTADFTIDSIMVLLFETSVVFLKVTLPFMMLVMLIGIAINYAQVGFLFTLEPLAPSLNKINPISGFQRLFSMRSINELIKSLLKIVIISYFIYDFLKDQITVLPQLITADIIDSLKLTGSLTVSVGLQVGGVLLVLGAIDYGFQWWQHNKSLKMSKQEIKDEFKQSEGDPQVKSKIKQKQRAMAMQRMMQEVPKASVVVTNPTHFAVALKYETGMSAPMIVAKGQDFIAQKIKTIAKENHVAVVENKPLARSLFRLTEVGDQVPQELYQAVAEVLAYVYRLQKRMR